LELDRQATRSRTMRGPMRWSLVVTCLASLLWLGVVTGCALPTTGSGDLIASPPCTPVTERGSRRFDPADHIQMRDGSAYVGVIANRVFSVQPPSASVPLTFGKEDIVWMVFRNDYDHAEDRVRLKDATEIGGMVLDAEIVLRSESFGPVTLETADVLAVQFLGTLGE
jgi:hypothetical protein